MSNALYLTYGAPVSSPWFPELRQMRCERPDAAFKTLDGQFPFECALYFLCANRGISYIGIAGTRKGGGLFRRLRQHWRDGHKLVEFVYAFGLPAACLDSWESEAIAHFRPSQNFRGRNLHLPENDALDGLPAYMEVKGYLKLFSGLRRFRIDTGQLPPRLC